MALSAAKINTFLFFKLPAAFLCGVRVKRLEADKCIVTVRHRWINQNPFNSMYFAVQAMAAELSTGALVMQAIRQSGKPISMLVAHSESDFSKKATGKITFECVDGPKISDAIARTLATAEGQRCRMKSIGTNEKGEVVSKMVFDWTVKSKS